MVYFCVVVDAVVKLQTKVVLAFLAVYLIWGSTYLAIWFVIETIPPFFMAGTRFMFAGAFLYVWARMRGASKVSLPHWKSAFVIGGLMLLGGHGAVVWAEQWIPSGLVSFGCHCALVDGVYGLAACWSQAQW
jgi:drug/metabolite transporter (DMT)-like permease